MWRLETASLHKNEDIDYLPAVTRVFSNPQSIDVYRLYIIVYSTSHGINHNLPTTLPETNIGPKNDGFQ